MKYVKLNNNTECPAIGIGTYMLTPEDARNSVREALKMGYTSAGRQLARRLPSSRESI